jgi:NADH-quinone oxidoreductase subunit D
MTETTTAGRGSQHELWYSGANAAIDAVDPMTLNMGPQHPSTHGVLRLVLDLDGERVVHCTPHLGYLHTGFEKSMEFKTYVQVVTFTDRMDYLGPLANNLAYCLAVEQLMGERVPPRCEAIRVILVELTRFSSHLLWLGSHAYDLGAMSTFLYCMRERERVLDVFEETSGVRMMTSFIRPGGLAKDVTPKFAGMVEDLLKMLPGRVDEYEALLTHNRIWEQRTRNIGVIPVQDLLDYGVSGPVLRAAGVDWDLRRDQPYSGYERYQFEVPVGSVGDVYDRYLVRVYEMRQSLRIIQQALEGMPEGDWQLANRKYVPPPREEMRHSMEALIHHFKYWTDGIRPPAGEVYQAIEGPRGELGFHIVSDGTRRPWRVKVRAPSFCNLQALPAMCEGRMVADVVALIGSIDIIMGDVDR